MLLVACLPLPSFGQSLADTLRRIDRFFSETGDSTAGAALLISRNGEVLYNKAFGMADLEHHIPNTPETIFEAGSVSKQFTSTAILLLAIEGKLSLDDPVAVYVPELSHYGEGLTIRTLINHTSGLKDWGSLAEIGGWARGTRIYTNDLALAYIARETTLNHVPGAEYIYSNSNYTVMTHIVERVSGMSLPEFTSTRLFRPLGMVNTTWRDDFQRIVSGRAVGYAKREDGYFTVMPFENTYGHAALLTTTADLDKWNTSWKNTPLGSDTLLAMRLTRGVLRSGDTIDYAAAVTVTTYNGHAAVAHSGSTAGYRAWLAYYPESGLSVSYLSNDGSLPVMDIANGIAAVFFGEPVKPAKVNTATESHAYVADNKSLVGLGGSYYSSVVDATIKLELKGDSLWMDRAHHEAILLAPTAKDRFKANGFTIAIKRDDHGEVVGLSVSVSRARDVWFGLRGGD